MQKRSITAHFDRERRREIVRFGIVGIVATALQYGLYLVFAPLMHPNIANTVAYADSFLFNYVASLRYTFRVKGTPRRGIGFIAAHAVNYLLQTVSLAFFLWTGLPRQWALLPVLAICVPVNFLLVRTAMKNRPKSAPVKH